MCTCGVGPPDTDKHLFIVLDRLLAAARHDRRDTARWQTYAQIAGYLVALSVGAGPFAMVHRSVANRATCRTLLAAGISPASILPSRRTRSRQAEALPISVTLHAWHGLADGPVLVTRHHRRTRTPGSGHRNGASAWCGRMRRVRQHGSSPVSRPRGQTKRVETDKQAVTRQAETGMQRCRRGR